MQYLLVAVIIILTSLQTLFAKMYSDRYPGDKELATPVFGVVEGAGVLLVTLVFTGFSVTLSPTTVLLGGINGLVLFGYNAGIIGAGRRGSFSFLNVASTFGGILTPILFTTLVLRDAPTVLQMCAGAVMLIAIALMNYEKDGEKKAGLPFYLFCLLVFVCNGAYSIMLKLQERYDATLIEAAGDKSAAQSTEMLMVTYAVMAILSLGMLIFRKKGGAFKAFRQTKGSALFLALAVLTVGLVMNVIVITIPLMNVAVLYTLMGGGVILLASLYSMILFKEKPSPLKIIGIALAIASVTALSI